MERWQLIKEAEKEMTSFVRHVRRDKASFVLELVAFEAYGRRLPKPRCKRVLVSLFPRKLPKSYCDFDSTR